MLEERFGPIGNERYRGYLRDIHASGRHVVSLVNDLLDIAKIEAGRADLVFTSLPRSPRSPPTARPCCAARPPRGRSSCAPPSAERLPRVVADERSLRQILARP